MSPPQASVDAELCAQIDELTRKIDVQKQLLRDLEEQRSQARRQLNSLHDPMARLPLEIQSHIFLCVDHTWDKPSTYPDNAPMVFVGVCRLWRHIALSTPRLWSTISMNNLPRRACYAELCGKWMERAGTLPLSMSLEGSSLRLARSGIQDLVYQYRDRLESLTLKLDGTHTDVTGLGALVDVDGPFKALRKLTISSQVGVALGSAEDVGLLNMLRDAPNLSHLVMHNFFYEEEDPDDPDVQPLTLASLETLELGSPQTFAFFASAGNSAAILQYLTLPALKDLHLSALDMSYDAFNAFLTRSSPPLEWLNLALHSGEWPDEVLSRSLRLVPTLTSLKISAWGTTSEDRFRPFFEVLASSRDVLPNLRKLTLWMRHSASVDYERIIRMLDNRRSCPAPLERLEIYFAQFGDQGHDYSTNLPSDGQIRSALEQFVKNGMQIHIGPSTRNLLENLSEEQQALRQKSEMEAIRSALRGAGFAGLRSSEYDSDPYHLEAREDKRRAKPIEYASPQ
ncbi:hypothetical protein R3P38DRAFT_3511982 [Favolaschia claudopus]|uniref:F-box domain-containing protein n=1 Tax=Favolaschia claudopus TaxID=2862362 RepID=A0AAV9Z0M9_9AGAR